MRRGAPLQPRTVTIVGAGIVGLWQALVFARRGHRVTLYEATAEGAVGPASRYAGAMLAPYCEEEGAEPRVRELGLQSIPLWRRAYPNVVNNGSLVVAHARDRPDLVRFQRMTRGHETIDGDRLGAIEPDLAGRFQTALFYPEEAHVVTRKALAFLASEARRLGADMRFNAPYAPLESEPGLVIDARGIAARNQLPTLRGVRGEVAVARARDVRLSRPVRLLHPRFPLYVVPWGDDLYLVGATVIEREDSGPVTVRSALDLLATAYALHPAFGEAEIVELSAGVRPSFPDNVPKVIVRGPNRLYVNGAYRHGFLMSPILAEAAADFVERGVRLDGIVVDG